MRPVTVINGIILGTCFSIAFSLAAVAVVFMILSDDYPRLEHESAALMQSLAMFTGMTALSGASFYALLVAHPMRWAGQVAMWAGVAAIVYAYLPE